MLREFIRRSQIFVVNTTFSSDKEGVEHREHNKFKLIKGVKTCRKKKKKKDSSWSGRHNIFGLFLNVACKIDNSKSVFDKKVNKIRKE
jgi:hypothetical protein